MDKEEIIRQEAIRLSLQGYSVQTISKELERSRQWVYKWLSHYKQATDKNWYKSQSKVPKRVVKKTPITIEQTVIEIRKHLSNNAYSQKGAISILYEFERLGITPPSLATINRILKRNNLIGQSPGKHVKTKEYPTYFFNVQQMDLIGPKYIKGGFKFYFYCIIDTLTHHGAVYPIRTKSALDIAPCLIDFWKNYGMPDFLQMDNELSFRGSNRYPRGLGTLLRVAISNKVTPIFTPPAEPWRNGIIEKFNDNVQKHFYYTQTFISFEEITEKARDFTLFHNEKHRYSTQSNKTPNQMSDIHSIAIKLINEIDLTSKIVIEEGRIIFIRFVRSDLKICILNTSFILKKELIYSYVVAEIVIEKHILLVFQNTTLQHIFPFAMPLS